jgi:Thioredoxin domain
VTAGVETEIRHVADAREIIANTILSTPGLVIDGKVVSTGRIPTERGRVAHVPGRRDPLQLPLLLRLQPQRGALCGVPVVHRPVRVPAMTPPIPTIQTVPSVSADRPTQRAVSERTHP